MTTKQTAILLDSHIFIWALEQVEKLGPATRQLLESGVTVYVSTASLWELAIKYQAKKFPYGTNALLQGLQASGFTLLEITVEHLETYSSIELAHKDPFDILLLAQAMSEQCILVTADHKLLTSKHSTHDAST